MPAQTERPGPTNDMQIGSYIHCGLCIAEYQKGVPDAIGESPATYARLEVGWTPLGLQIWCRRHECNVCHIDFEGQKHRANMTRKK